MYGRRNNGKRRKQSDILGNLGRDPEIRYTASGNPVASVSIATSEAWRDRNSGEMQERTEWHDLVFFSRLAEIAGEYLSKGSKIYVKGSLRTQRYTDKNDIERFRTEVIVRELHMLGGGGFDQFNQDQEPKQQAQQNKTQANKAQNNKSSTYSPRDNENMPDFDTFDDDIPFN